MSGEEKTVDTFEIEHHHVQAELVVDLLNIAVCEWALGSFEQFVDLLPEYEHVALLWLLKWHRDRLEVLVSKWRQKFSDSNSVVYSSKFIIFFCI